MSDLIGPEVRITNIQPIIDLREVRFHSPDAQLLLGEFEFSSGRAGQIVVSRRIAPAEGMHLMVVAADKSEGGFSPQDVSDAVLAGINFMNKHPVLSALGSDPAIGYTILMNRGGMKNKPDAPDHVQIIVPGSAEDRQRAPRSTDPWRKV